MEQCLVSTNSSSPENITRATKVQSKLIQPSMTESMQGNEKSTFKRKRSCPCGCRNSIQDNYEHQIRITARLLNICIPSLRQNNRLAKRERIVIRAILGDYDHISEKENDTLSDRLSYDLCINQLNRDVKAHKKAVSCDYKEITTQSEPVAEDINKTIGVRSLSVLLDPGSTHQPQVAHNLHHVRTRSLPTYALRQSCVFDEHPLRTSDLSVIASNINDISDDTKILDFVSISKTSRVRSRRRSLLKFPLSLRSIKLITSSLLSSVKVLYNLRKSIFVSKISSAMKVSKTEDNVTVSLASIPTIEFPRYFNPDINTFLKRPSSRSNHKTRREKNCLVSIQMQTYKVSTSCKYPMCSVISLRSQPSSDEEKTNEICEPNMRQREIRENSDFMRIAVMEMLMRKRGKLNNKRPGKAKLALPPRTTSNKPYETRADGVPVRWISITV